MDAFQQIFHILLTYILTKRYAEGAATLSAGRRVAEGVPYSLVCTESSAISKNVLFLKNDVNQGGCVSSTCQSNEPGYSVTQNTTSTTLHIDSVNGSREAGSWTCQHGGDPKSSPFVIALPIPAYLNESFITTDPSQGSSITPPQVIVVSVPCAYPVPTVTWSYTKDGVPTTVSGNDVSDQTGCPSGQNKLNSSLNTANIDGVGNTTLKVKVEHDSFNPANNYARLFNFTVNFGAPTTTPTTSPDASSTTDSIPNSSSETSSSPTSVENTTATNKTAEASDESPFACLSNCVEETRRIYLSVFLPVLILVAIDVVVIVSVVSKDRGQNKRA